MWRPSSKVEILTPVFVFFDFNNFFSGHLQPKLKSPSPWQIDLDNMSSPSSPGHPDSTVESFSCDLDQDVHHLFNCWHQRTAIPFPYEEDLTAPSTPWVSLPFVFISVILQLSSPVHKKNIEVETPKGNREGWPFRIVSSTVSSFQLKSPRSGRSILSHIFPPELRPFVI